MTPDDQPRDVLTDHLLARADEFDPFARDAELASSIVPLPQPLGGGVRVVRYDEPPFSRPSAIVR
jgi:hypothetical protein